MKSKLYIIISGIFFTIFFIGCKTASKLYEKGNYDEAVQLAVKKLQKKPGDAELRDIIVKAYNYAVTDHESRIAALDQSNDELRWEKIHNEYSSLQSMYEAIYHAPVIMEIVHPVDYSSQLINTASKAADARYDRGMQLMNTGNREAFKKAYYEFEKALYYKPGDNEIASAKEDAFQAAVVRVLVLPVENDGFRYSSYNSFETNQMENDLIRSLQYQTANPFVQFFSNSDMRLSGTVPDEIIDIRFGQINVGRIYEDNIAKEVSKKVVIKETVYKPDSVVKEYGTAKAKIITTRRSISADGTAEFTIRDQDGRWLSNDRVFVPYNWSTVSYSYKGDKKALSDEEAKLVDCPAATVPNQRDVANQVMQDLKNDISYKIRNYYSRY